MEFWNWLLAHWGYISAAIVLVLKWVYNAWTPNVSFPLFIRQFIGEVVQEQPANLKAEVLAAENVPVAPHA